MKTRQQIEEEIIRQRHLEEDRLGETDTAERYFGAARHAAIIEALEWVLEDEGEVPF